MATTNRLTLTRLQAGEDTAEVSITPPGDGLVLKLTTVQIGGNPCQAILAVKDSQGRNMGTVTCQDGDDKRLSIEGFESGALTFQVSCNLGTCDVQVDELSDLDAVLPESDGQLEIDDIPDDSVGEAKLTFNAKGLGVNNLDVVADPGDGQTIVAPAWGFRVNLVSAGAETRVMGAPNFIGQVCILFFQTDGGNITMTNSEGWQDGTTGNDVATFTDVGEVMVLIACGTTAGDWRSIAQNGVTLS